VLPGSNAFSATGSAVHYCLHTLRPGQPDRFLVQAIRVEIMIPVAVDAAINSLRLMTFMMSPFLGVDQACGKTASFSMVPQHGRIGYQELLAGFYSGGELRLCLVAVGQGRMPDTKSRSGRRGGVHCRKYPLAPS
jgi:hypothetical protein